MLGLGLGIKKNSFQARGVLESYKSSVVAGFSYYQLFSTSKNCVEVRRSSDNSTQTFGFKNGYIDINSILAFCGSGSGYVKTWYNQFLQGNNAVQTTSGKQPKIVNSGVFEDDGLKFTSSDLCYMSILDYTNIQITTPKLQLYTNFKILATGSGYIISKNLNNSTSITYGINWETAGNLVTLRLTNFFKLHPQSFTVNDKIKCICNFVNNSTNGISINTVANSIESTVYDTLATNLTNYQQVTIGARHDSTLGYSIYINANIKTILINNDVIPNNILRKV